MITIADAEVLESPVKKIKGSNDTISFEDKEPVVLWIHKLYGNCRLGDLSEIMNKKLLQVAESAIKEINSISYFAKEYINEIESFLRKNRMI